MKVLIACAVIITATVGLAGCFHHDQTVASEPLKLS